MKNIISNLLNKAKKIPPYVFIWLSLPVLSLSLSYIFEDHLVLNPRGTLSTIILFLMILFFVWFIINLFLPVESNEALKNTEENIPLKRKRVFKLRLARREFKIPIRGLLFFFIGFFYVTYFFVSTIFFEKLSNSSLALIPIFIFFPILYLILSLLIFWALEITKKFYRWLYSIDYKRDKIKEDYNGFENPEGPFYDIVGFYSGGVVAGVIILGLAIVCFFILVIKGIIWLIHNPNPWGIIVAIALPCFLLVYFWTRSDIKELNRELKESDDYF